MARKRNSGNTLTIILALALVVVALGMVFNVTGTGGQSDSETIQQITAGVGAENFRSNNPDVDLELRLEDNEGSSIAFRNFTALIQDVSNPDDPIVITRDGVLTTSAFNDLTNALIAGNAYKIYIQTNNNGTNSLPVIELSASDTLSDPVRRSVSGASAYSTLQVRVHDNNNDGFLVGNGSNSVGITDNVIVPGVITGFGDLVANLSATGTSVNVSGTYDVRIEMKTTQTDQIFGQPYGYLVAIDSSTDTTTDQWDESQISFTANNGACTDVSDSWNINDLKALQTFEVIYHCEGQIGDVTRVKHELSIAAGTGVNPQQDIDLRFVHLGDFLDQEDPNKVLTAVGFQNDGTVRTQLTSNMRISLFVN